jgi:5'(3')-deoxyribonucleotidase
MNIAIDLDDTLVELDSVDRVSEVYGLNYKKSDVLTWTYNEFPENFRSAIFAKFIDADYMCSLRPFLNVTEKLVDLKNQGHYLICATSRDLKIKDRSIEFIKKTFPQFDKILVEPDKVPNLIQYKPDILIDDSPKHIMKSLSYGIESYLISNNDTKYNWYIKDLPSVRDNPKFHVVESFDKINL